MQKKYQTNIAKTSVKEIAKISERNTRRHSTVWRRHERPWFVSIVWLITQRYEILSYVTTKGLPIIPPPPMVAAEITRGRVARDKGLPVSARPGPRCK